MNDKRSLKQLFVLPLVVLLLTGCGVEPAEPTAAPTPVPPTATPARGLAVQIERLCLQIDESRFQNAALEPLNEDLEHILNLADIRVERDASAACDATLLISLVGSPLSGEYLDLPKANTYVTCYTGASVRGEMTLQQPDRQPLVMPISGRNPVDAGTISRCPSAANAPFYGISMAALLDGLETFWGTQMLVYAQVVDPELNRLAVERLQEQNPEQAVPGIINLLDTHPDAFVRLAALKTLVEIGRSVSETLPAIRQSLQDEDESVREMAFEALALIEPDAPEVVLQSNLKRILGELENSQDENIQIEAVRTLGQLGADEVVIQALIGVFEDSDGSDRVREEVASTLAGIGPETVPWLIEALEHEDQLVVEGSALSLKKMGGDSESAIPALINCITTQSWPSTEFKCESALLAIGPEVVQPLVDYVLTQAECDNGLALFLNKSAQSYPEIRRTTPYLIDCLEIDPGSISYYQTLRFFTGEDFGEDVTAWREWWSENR